MPFSQYNSNVHSPLVYSTPNQPFLDLHLLYSHFFCHYRHSPSTYIFTFYVFYTRWRLETFLQKYRKTEKISVHNESNPKTVITSIPITPMFLEDTRESSAEVSFRMDEDSFFLLMISSFFLLSMDSWRVIFTSSQTQTQVTLLVICVDPLVL